MRPMLHLFAALFAWSAGAEPPRTPDGRPDFSGTWNYGSLTPLERPARFADKSHFTPQEAADFELNFSSYMEEHFRQLEGDEFVGVDLWLNYGAGVEPDLRTSRIIDPPNGKLPELTPAGEERRGKGGVRRLSYAGPEVLSTTERCLSVPAAIHAAPDGNFLNILQNEDDLVISFEFADTTRIIPLDRPPFPAQDIRSLTGYSSGGWNGDVLEVETRNFRSEHSLEGSGPNMVLTERFSMEDPDLLRYEFTVDDPENFTAPWTVRTYLRRDHGVVYEYACHEGNMRNMQGILKGSRVMETAGG